jgi:hypothetical protein
MFLVFAGWAFGFWWAAGWPPLVRVGTVLAGFGLALIAAGAYFRWQGWD